MQVWYVVIDGTGNISWDLDANAGDAAPERFTTLDDAEERAKEIARDEPGTTVLVYKLFAAYRSDVSAPQKIAEIDQ